MPSPIGHVLGGLAAGWLVAGRSTAAPGVARARSSGGRTRSIGRAVLFGVLGAAPDLDLLFGTHSTYTHSVGAVALTAGAALLWTRGRQPRAGSRVRSRGRQPCAARLARERYDAPAWRHGLVAVHARVLPVALLPLHGHLAPVVAARLLQPERRGRTAGAGHPHTHRRPHRSRSGASRRRRR